MAFLIYDGTGVPLGQWLGAWAFLGIVVVVVIVFGAFSDAWSDWRNKR